MNALTEAMVTIAMGIIGIAILAVLVSNRANTANVLGAAGSAFAKSIGAATAPVTGGGGFSLPSVSGYGGY